MKTMTFPHSTPRTDAEYEADFDLLLAEMRRMSETMDDNRREIDRLKAEASVLKAETRAILISMGAQI